MQVCFFFYFTTGYIPSCFCKLCMLSWSSLSLAINSLFSLSCISTFKKTEVIFHFSKIIIIAKIYGSQLYCKWSDGSKKFHCVLIKKAPHVTCLHALLSEGRRVITTKGSFSNDDRDGNKNGMKAIEQLCTYSTFFGTFLRKPNKSTEGKTEISGGKSNVTRHTDWKASEKLGCDLGRCKFLPFLVCSADLDVLCSGPFSHYDTLFHSFIYKKQDFHQAPLSLLPGWTLQTLQLSRGPYYKENKCQYSVSTLLYNDLLGMGVLG